MTVILRDQGTDGVIPVSIAEAQYIFDSAIVRLTDGSYVIAWTDWSNNMSRVFAQHFDSTGATLGAAFQADATTNHQYSPEVAALVDGGYIVTWSANMPLGNGSDVYSQRYDASGLSVGGVTLVNSHAADGQNLPSITGLTVGGYVIVWESLGQDGDDNGIYGQLYNADGDVIGTETHISTFTALSQEAPRVTGLADGGYVVAWTSQGQDGGGAGIYAQAYNSTGHAVGVETLVNSTVAGSQDSPDVIALRDGGYVIAWSSVGGPHFQIFDANGLAAGSETRVNTQATGGQIGEKICALSDGGFMVAWQDYPPYSGGTVDIKEQRFDSSGEKLGDAQLVAHTNTNAVSELSVTGLKDGGFVVAWAAVAAHGDDEYQAIFSAADTNDSGSHLIYGTAGADTIVGTLGQDVIFGGSGIDHLIAKDVPADYYTPGDILDGGSGADILTGSVGNDTFYVDNPGDTVLELADGGYDLIIASTSYVLGSHNNVENLQLAGSSNISGTGNELFNDIVGNTGSNLLDGAAGDDRLHWGAGQDTLDGGAGSDLMVYNVSDHGSLYTTFAVNFTGIETPTGVIFSDGTVARNIETVWFSGGYGNDTAIGGQEHDDFSANWGQDVFNGGGGNDTFEHNVGSGNGTFIADGGEGIDSAFIFSYSSSNPVLFDAAAGASAEGETLYTGDIVRNIEQYYVYAGSGNDTLNGGDGNDTLGSQWGADSINGGGGDDVISSNNLDDKIDGGEGTDRLDTYCSGQSVTAHADDAGNYSISIDGQPVWVTKSIESVTLSVYASVDATLVGAAGDDIILSFSGTSHIDGASGNDSLSGGTGADNLIGGLGNDTLAGGAGNDTYSVDSVGDVVNEKTDGGSDLVRSTISYRLGANLENLILSGLGNFNATGNGLANVLTGNDGNNMLDGMGGADTMTGGLGDDTYSVENAGDVVTELADQGIDTVKTNLASYTLGANVENLILTGAGNISGTGNGLNNTLVGNGANNSLIGGAGDDTLSGGAGDDLLNGGTGGDRLIGGLGNDTYQLGVLDTIIEQANAGIDTVLSSLAVYTLGATLENVSLIGSALNANGNGLDNAMSGNGLNNLLQGGDGRDTISGMAGNDTINGGTGADVLSGGAGNDVFLYRALVDSPSSRRDLITDFAAGDKIDLRQIDADTVTGGDQAFHQVVAFGHHAGELVLSYDAGANRTLLTVDVNGDAVSDLFVYMTGSHVSAADWLL